MTVNDYGFLIGLVTWAIAFFHVMNPQNGKLSKHQKILLLGVSKIGVLFMALALLVKEGII